MNTVNTPGHTVGPFFGIALPYDGGAQLVPDDHPDAVRLHGRVLDGHGQPVPDALLELWQADTAGRVVQRAGSLRRDGATFTGWGRAATDVEGHYSFTTLMPAAPFFSLSVFARGLTHRLLTRAYLPDAVDDPFLAGVEPDRRQSLVATPDEQGLAFDIRLQGERETVFLRYRHDWPL